MELTGWAVTDTAHDPTCVGCLKYAEPAAEFAERHHLRSTTFGDSPNRAALRCHSVTVTKAYGLVFTGVASTEDITFFSRDFS